VRISSAKKVDENFSARFSATSRCYRYFIQTGTQPFAHESRYRWFIPNRPEIHVLNSMAEILRGEMDFKTFAAAGDRSISTFRYVEDAFFFRDESNPDLLVFQIEANAFLWKMVRSLTGTLIRLEQKGSDSAEFKKILDRKDRKFSLFTAPPQGLFLWDVKFDGKRRHV
jgi:tRNA pseudouridine38-40 synthase